MYISHKHWKIYCLPAMLLAQLRTKTSQDYTGQYDFNGCPILTVFDDWIAQFCRTILGFVPMSNFND